MPIYSVVGTQWGDEGKGKLIDVLADSADYVVRYQGGNNAGHTVVVGDEKFVLHLLPSGVLHPRAKCLIATGVVVDIPVLLREIATLQAKGVATDHIFISDRCHLIMPYHIKLDELKEQSHQKIGTTKRGIGPAYVDKYDRCGIRMADLFNDNILYQKIKENLSHKNLILQHIYQAAPFDADLLFEEYRQYADLLRERVIDTRLEMQNALHNEKMILCEGAQALMLDIDYGTYPYVTSSSPTVGAISVGTGIAPQHIKRSYGVMKAYATRVGEGVFVTEQNNDTGAYLRNKGNEYGSTTGRARRIGWLDLPVVRYACQINGLSDVVMTKIDVLSGLDEIQVAVAYRCGGDHPTRNIPADLSYPNADISAVYETFEGWNEDLSAIKNYHDLPAACRRYIEFIEDYLQTPLTMISVGPERNQNIFKNGSIK